MENKNLIKCPKCTALFSKTVSIIYGRYDTGTAGIFTPNGMVQEPYEKTGECPICGYSFKNKNKGKDWFNF